MKTESQSGDVKISPLPNVAFLSREIPTTEYDTRALHLYSRCFSLFPHPHHHYLKIFVDPLCLEVQYIVHKICHFNRLHMYNPSGNPFTCAVNTTIHVQPTCSLSQTNLSPANGSFYFSRTRPQATSRPLSLDLPTRGT